MIRSGLSLHTALQRSLALVVATFLFAAFAPTTQAQRVGDTFYGKIGAGLSDYTGDFPAQNVGHPLDFQEVLRGSGVPVTVAGEVGYQFSPRWALAVGFQGGNYPMVGYAGQGDGISDSYRYTPQLLGRYTFGGAAQSIAPYVDGGVNVTFGGATGTGAGPSLGVGIDVPVSRSLSLYLESRFNFTFPDDAIDGSGASGAGGAFDSVNQLLGAGLKVTFSSPAPPRIITVDGPVEVQTGEAATFTATINEGEATRPVRREWAFGSGTTASGQTATHTYDRPGTYTVSFSASNAAGTVSESITVEATRPSKDPTTLSRTARIASLTATPNPAAVGTPVQFNSAVEGRSSPTYEWDFGDGTTGTGSSSTHTYDRPGQYTVQLQVETDADTDARIATVRVERGARDAPSKQWRIVVASMRDDGGAEVVARRYRKRLAESMPINVVTATTDEGLRHRVVVGEFENEAAARQALAKYGPAFPSDAWTLRLQPSTSAFESEERPDDVSSSAGEGGNRP